VDDDADITMFFSDAF